MRGVHMPSPGRRPRSHWSQRRERTTQDLVFQRGRNCVVVAVVRRWERCERRWEVAREWWVVVIRRRGRNKARGRRMEGGMEERGVEMEGGMEERRVERKVERKVVIEGGREERKVGMKGVVKLCGESPMVVVV